MAQYVSLAGSVSSGLWAALLFARGRQDALRYVEVDMAGAARSFWAMAVGLPAIVCLRLMVWAQHGLPQQAGHTFSLDIAGYVLGWLLFALLTFHLTNWFGRGQYWPRFITAWNWCNVIENLLLVFGGIPALFGAPPLIDEAAQIFAIGWALWIEWFATKHTLSTTGLTAAGLVILDQMIGFTLAALNTALLQN